MRRVVLSCVVAAVIATVACRTESGPGERAAEVDRPGHSDTPDGSDAPQGSDTPPVGEPTADPDVDDGPDGGVVDGSDGVDPGNDTPVDDVGEVPSPGRAHFVVVTLNTHSMQEPGDPIAHLESIGEGLASLDVDLVGLNEVMSGAMFAYGRDGTWVDAAAVIRASLERASGVSFSMARAGFARWDSGEEMSNVILSRTPFIETDVRSLPTTDFWPAPHGARNVVYARTVVPGLGIVNAFVTHTWGWDSADTRPQIDGVKRFMAEKFRGDEAVDFVIGDLNLPPHADAFGHWLGGAPFRLVDTWAGDTTESTVWNEPHRIDYILAGTGFPIIDDLSRRTTSIVFDGGFLPRLSDHKGVMATFTLSE